MPPKPYSKGQSNKGLLVEKKREVDAKQKGIKTSRLKNIRELIPNRSLPDQKRKKSGNKNIGKPIAMCKESEKYEPKIPKKFSTSLSVAFLRLGSSFEYEINDPDENIKKANKMSPRSLKRISFRILLCSPNWGESL